MSSERAGTPTSDKWEVVYEYDSFDDAEGAYVGADRPYDRALPGSPTIRRAGVHTSGALNREAARAMVAAEFPGSTPSDRLLDALEACVVPDPRWVEVDDLNDFRQPDRTGRALVEYGGPNIVHVYVPADQ